jgi:hypothetical protein
MSTKKTASKTPAKQAVLLLPTQFIQAGFWRQHLTPVLLLLLASFVFYGITIGYGYLQDDQLFIWDNAFVQKGFAGLAQIFGNDSLLGYYKDPKLMLEGGRYRPIPLATFAIEIGLFGKGNPGVAHFFNVVFYGLTGIFLYRVLSGLFPRKEGPWYFSIPFLAALIFMVHPLHVEVVANIKGRDEIFALLGSLGALWAMMKHFDTQENKWKWIAAGSFLLGLLSKENTATFLAVIPLTLWVFSTVPFQRILTASLPLLWATLLFFIMRASALETPIAHADELVLNPFFGMTGAEKFAAIFLSLGWDLKLLFFPHPLTIDYYPYHVPKVSWTDWRVMLSLATLLTLGVWAYRQIQKPRNGDASGWWVPAYSVLYFLLTISVVSNIFVRTSTFLNERYLFMPSVGFCVLVAWFLARKLPEILRKSPDQVNLWSSVILGTLLVLFSLRTWTRIPDWGGDGAGLVESAIRVSGGSYRANYYYANMIYQNKYLKIEKATDAPTVAQRNELVNTIDQYVTRALEINPGYRLAAPLKVQMAVARYNEDKDLDKLLKSLERLIQGQPLNGNMLTMVLNVLKSFKSADPNIYNFFCHRVGYNFYYIKMQDPEGAITFLNLALANFPQDKNTMQDLIQIYTTMGNQGKVRELQQRMSM